MHHIAVVHDSISDEPRHEVYEGITREITGSRYQLVQGESGKFYCKELELGIHSLQKYGRDMHNYNSFSVPIEVSIFSPNLGVE